MEEIYRVCQKALVLDRGQVLAKQAVFDRPGTHAVARLTGYKNYSALAAINTHRVRALDWNCTLQVEEEVTAAHRQIAIRAHRLTFEDGDSGEAINRFPVWVAWTSETPHRMTLFLKLGAPPPTATITTSKPRCSKKNGNGCALALTLGR